MTYTIKQTSSFKKDLRKIINQKKNIDKLHYIIDMIAAGNKLDEKYKDHELNNSKHYKNCRECHIEPDWLLIYKIDNYELILLLVETGSHSELF